MSIAINTPLEDRDFQSKPWYRYGWPWFLISVPLVSMLLGGMMLYLGLSANNSLVVDDYYKEGKAINLRIERDRIAALLGMQADLWTTAEGIVLELSTQAPRLPEKLQADAALAHEAFTQPDSLQLRWVHVTQAQRDGEAVLQSLGGGRYLAVDSSLPASGKYRLHVQPVVDPSWRLVSKLFTLEDHDAFALPAMQPEAVFNQSLFE